jgi:serine/threonine protein kinase
MTTGALQGTTIGSYVVRHEIGNGGMGAVYLVEHTMLGRRAALKVLHPEMSANQEMVQRFFNEARAASAIKSPGIVEIYDFGYHTNGSAYIVMELLEGESLSMRLNRYCSRQVPQALQSAQALIIARQVASALARRTAPALCIAISSRTTSTLCPTPRWRAESAPRSSTSASPSSPVMAWAAA